jgi:hypothetical protein
MVLIHPKKKKNVTNEDCFCNNDENHEIVEQLSHTLDMYHNKLKDLGRIGFQYDHSPH